MTIFMTILSITGLVSEALQNVLTGGAAKSDALAQTLLKIAQQAGAAYEAHTGQPIDPSALKPINPA